jgi:hypothetical protein
MSNILERKIILNIEEYVDFVRSYFGKLWTMDGLDDLKRVHDIPSSFPAIVWIEKIHDPDGCFADNCRNHIKFIDRENVIIPRREDKRM